MRARISLAVLGLAALAATSQAQAPDSVQPARPGGRPMIERMRARAAAREAQGKPPKPFREEAPEKRQAAERKIRQAFQGVVRRRLNLDDAKMRRLEETNLKFDQRRRALNVDERQARIALRSAMQDTVTRDEGRISQAIDQLIAAQRRRTDLLADEQKELSSFLTPLQRAQYLSLQEQVNRRLMDAQRGGALGGQPPKKAPPES